MTCTPIRTSSGVTGIVCHGRGRRVKPKKCSVCGRPPALLECDGKNPKRKSGTCDKLLCAKCAVRAGDQLLPRYNETPGTESLPFRVAADKAVGRIVDTLDYCPDCAKALERARRTPVQGDLFR